MEVYKNGQKDQPLGYVRRVDLLSRLLDGASQTAKDHVVDISGLIREPLYLPETISILKALEEFRKTKAALGFVIDEFGNFEGVISLHDIMEEIAGELPEQAEVPELVRVSPGVFRIAGDAILKDVSRLTGFKVPPSDNYHTMAGFILDYLQRMPLQGEIISLAKWTITIMKVSETTVASVELKNLSAQPDKKAGR